MLILKIAICVVLAYILYTVLAELVLHLWHVGVFYNGASNKRTVGLTFDDGPHPEYTPAILDILAHYDVRASFFVVAERALKYPDIVRRIVADGHSLGSHSNTHRHAWLRGPLQTWRDIAAAQAAIAKITGRPVTFYRPPWGAMNWMLWFACKRFGLTLCLWSVRALDWTAHATPATICGNVLAAVEPGAIVLCHDNGGALGAPQRTIAALPEMIRQLQSLGYAFATVDAMYENKKQAQAATLMYKSYPLRRRILISMWSVVEYIFTKVYKVRTQSAMFRVSETKWHHGPRFDEHGLKTLDNGSLALDLHFRNDTLISLSTGSDNRAIIRTLKMTRDGLRDIAKLLLHHPLYREVEAVAAVTLMNRGIEMLGFHVETLPPTTETKRLQFYMQFLLGMYHPEGFHRLRQGNQALTLKLVWMTRNELISRYRDDHAESHALPAQPTSAAQS